MVLTIRLRPQRYLYSLEWRFVLFLQPVARPDCYFRIYLRAFNGCNVLGQGTVNRVPAKYVTAAATVANNPIHPKNCQTITQGRIQVDGVPV